MTHHSSTIFSSEITNNWINHLLTLHSPTYFPAMGSSSSSEVADTIETDNKETKNFGLLNISNDLGGGFNALEIITFILVLMAAIIFLKTFCARRRKKRLDEMHKRLQGISLPENPPPPPMVRVQAAAARVPILGDHPPVYPGNQVTSSVMEKYDI